MQSYCNETRNKQQKEGLDNSQVCGKQHILKQQMNQKGNHKGIGKYLETN